MRAKCALGWILAFTKACDFYNLKWNLSKCKMSSHCNSREQKSQSDKVKFIDIGANLTDSMYSGIYYGKQKHTGDLKEVIARAREHNIKLIITAGCLEDVYNALEICRKYDEQGTFLYTTAGVHPTQCNEFITNKFNLDADEYIAKLDELINDNKDRIVAIGELGLDYDRLNYCSVPVQKKNKQKWDIGGGVCHSFTSDVESLQRLLADGFYIGLNGCSLKTELNLETVRHIPLERILLETDCPWCGITRAHASHQYVKTHFEFINRPEKMDGTKLCSKRNEPIRIIQVAQVVHAIKCPDLNFSAFCNTYVPLVCLPKAPAFMKTL
ncbi:bifunctional Deoxyribonuclease [Babesia duncani]|uniref:Bifunctional Deoxyribonuclease n=1 Tax=Babesia duncani TaxID=323732 RepID=A0AAD9PIR1_9APIC|nr:bifunctional Deoxyribonuclease [Babesia duncani]